MLKWLKLVTVLVQTSSLKLQWWSVDVVWICLCLATELKLEILTSVHLHLGCVRSNITSDLWPFPNYPTRGLFIQKKTPESTALWSSAFQFQLSLNPNGRRLKWKDWIKASTFFLFLFGERRLWPTCNYFSSLWLPSRLISLHPFSPSPSPPPSLSPSTARLVSQSVLFPVSWQRIGLSENPLMQD